MGLIISSLAHYGPLAQLVEHLTFNQVVEGSIPSRLISSFLLKTWKSPSSSLAQDTGLSRRRRGFESRWGRQFYPTSLISLIVYL